MRGPATWALVLALWWAGLLLTWIAVGAGLADLILADRLKLRKRGARRATIAIDDRGLHVDGALLAARGEIRSAWRMLPLSSNGVGISFATSPSAVLIEAPDADSADRILAAIGPAVNTQLGVFIGASTYFPVSWLAIFLLALGAVASLVLSAPPAIGLLLGVVSWIAVTLITRVRLDVGADGVLLQRHGRRTFTPYAHVKSVVASKGRVTIRLHSGAPIRLRFDSRDSAVDADELRHRILDTMSQRTSSAQDGHDVHAFLVRGGRDVKTWIRATATLTGSDADAYRIATLAPEQLWAAVEDGGGAPMVRVGAALALRPTLDDEGRARLRLASTTTFTRDVRVALKSIADAEDDVRLEATLANMSASEDGAVNRIDRARA